MKLLTKTGLNFISASVFFFLFASLGGYYFIRFAVNKYLDNELKESYTLFHLLSMDELKNASFSYIDLQIDSVDHEVISDEYEINDIVIFNPATELGEVYRQLSFSKLENDTRYQIKLRRSTSSTDLLVMKFTLMLTVFPIIFFIILYLVNRQAIKHSLSVFYDTINKLKGFDVNKDNKLDLMTSDIDEFEQLNEVFNAMGEKIKEDYERLKQYTENTSHELQTPLAIITSKLDELLQAPNLTESQIKNVAGLMETTGRLSKINQALIYFAKLDNRLFGSVEPIDFNEVIHTQINLFEPLLEDKSLRFEMKEDSEPMVFNMNKSLATTLVQNLLKNAIRHNLDKGLIGVEITKNRLVIKNGGKPLSLSVNEMFHRFKKESTSPNSMGIGLSIVKRICDISDIDISYHYKNNLHYFSLVFKA